MTDVHAGDTFTFTVNGDDHFLASDFGPVNLVDPTTQKVIGSYVVDVYKRQVVDSEQASAGAAKPQIQQKTWTGEVFIVETKEERPFGSPEELARILASLEQAA